jgi:glycosyltransferase involved in cell wall biosynthesis
MKLLISVLLPVMDEVSSLQQTVEILLAENKKDIHEILITTSPFTSQSALIMASRLEVENPGTVRIIKQVKKYLGGAIQDGIAMANGSSILLMASDLETDPKLVAPMIHAYRERHGRYIVASSRWAPGGTFSGYNPLKQVLNFIFQGLVRTVLGIKLTDSTFAFRLYPSDALRDYQWVEDRHAFLLEALVRPVARGWPYVEIPAVWRARTEGVSHNSFALNFLYFRVVARAILEKLRVR